MKIDFIEKVRNLIENQKEEENDDKSFIGLLVFIEPQK